MAFIIAIIRIFRNAAFGVASVNIPIDSWRCRWWLDQKTYTNSTQKICLSSVVRAANATNETQSLEQINTLYLN